MTYLAMCVCMCVFAIGARIVSATELKFCTERGLHPEKTIAIVRAARTHPRGAGGSKMGSRGLHSPNGAFMGRFYKTKVKEHPQLSGGGSGQIRSRTSPWGPAACPSSKGRSAAVVPWPIKLKLVTCVTHLGTLTQ